jgi:hypothetical protein
MADLVKLVGPVSVANLAADAGALTGEDGFWWPCIDLTWRTPVPPSITRIVAQVRQRGTEAPVAETVLATAEIAAGAARIVNGVSVGQHLQVRLAPAGAPGLPFKPTPWVDVTTPWDAIIGDVDGLSIGCVKEYCGEGVPTRTGVPNGSRYTREDVSQLWRYDIDSGAGTLALANAGFETGDTTGWTATTGAIGVSTGYSDIFGLTAPRTGAYMLSCLGTVGSVVFHQDFAIPAGAEGAIDDGIVAISNVGAWHNPGGGFGSNDQGRVFLTFLDGVGAPIGSTIYTAWNQAHSIWTHLTIPETDVPAGTRTIRIGAESLPEDGTHDSFFDDFDAPSLSNIGGWVLMSDLTSIRLNGVEIEGSARSLNLVGDFEVTTDAEHNVTVTAQGPFIDAVTSQAVTAGQVGSFHNSSGAKVRKASAADDTKQAHCFFRADFASGATARCHLPGSVIRGLSGLTPGAIYFLDPATPGAITVTPPSTAGQWLQEVGVAGSATELVFFPKSGVLL